MEMIVRRQHNSGFQVMPNRVFNDEALSLDARGLMGYLLAKPDHWQANVEDIQRRCGVGRDKAYKLIRELIAAGYVQRRANRNERGQITGHDYVVFDCPTADEPLPENTEVDTEIQDEPLPDLPDTANQHAYINTDSKQILNSPKRDARGRRLPDDWRPSAVDETFALGEGLTPAEIDDQAERFRDYWHAKAGAGARKVDWAGTWRNWIRKSLDYGNGGNRKGRTETSRRGGSSPQDRQLAAFLEVGAGNVGGTGRGH